MKLEKPEGVLLDYLKTMGLGELRNIELDDAEVAEMQEHVHQQFSEHTEEECQARAVARLAWKKYGMPERAAGAREVVAKDAEDRELSSIHTIARVVDEKHFPALIEAIQKAPHETVEIGKDICAVIEDAKNDMAKDVLKLAMALAEKMDEETKRVIEVGLAVRRTLLWLGVGIGLLIAAVLLAPRLHGQVDCVQWQNSAGAVVANYCAPFKVKEGSNITFSKSGTTVTVTGSAAPVSSVTGTANEITCSPTTGAVICSLPTGLTFTGKTVTNGTLTTPIISGYTVAGLPAATTAGQIVVVTDASTAGSCTVGGGSAIAFCRASGAAWVPLGDGGGAGANQTLSNLTAPVALNEPLLPDAAAADDFGSALLPFKEIYFAGSSGTPGTNNFKITGASTSGTRTVTAADGNSVTVIGDAGAANNFVTAISPTTGIISKAQPDFSNLSGALGSTQITGTSGGVPYFSAANTYGSSAALASGQFVLGGGAGAAPATSFSVVPVANGGTGTGSTLTGLVRGSASAFTAAELSGDATTSGSNAVSLAAKFKTKTCTVIIGDPGAGSAALADDNDSPVACSNDTGVDWTITRVGCWANAGSPTVTPILTGGAATSILTGALTCGTAAWASGTVNGSPVVKSFSNGATCSVTPCTADVNITTAGGTAKYIVVRIGGTIP